MNLYEELKRRLNQDFSAANLDSAATLAFESSWNASRPLGLFVVTRVLRILADQWDLPNLRDEAYMSQDAVSFMEESLRSPLMRYLEAASRDLDGAIELQFLNDIVLALFKWTSERPPARA